MRSDSVKKNRSEHGYNSLAPIYQTLEMCLFGRSLQHARVALLDRLVVSKNALILGDGNGKLLEQFCLSQPQCSITSVDQSEVMLRLQRQRITRAGAEGRVTFLRQDARMLQPRSGSFDLIVAAFFLDCFTERELAACLPHWLTGLQPGGHFYFIDFTEPKTRWRRYQAAAYQSLMHWFFRWQTGLPNRQLIDLKNVLDQHGLSVIECSTEVHPMIACRIYRKTTS